MASRQDLTDDDRKMLRYINDHVRFWSAVELAPHFGLSAAEARTQLDALEQAGYIRRLNETAATPDPTFTLTGSGIEAAVS
jgi:predicted ArsR family transcriptional regulator